jgi:solute carrier family 25 protein 38
MADTLSVRKFYSYFPQDALAGAMSGFLIGVMLQPLEIIKMCLIVNPMQVALLEKSNFAISFYTSARLIYQMEGYKGFYRGLSPALLRIAAGSAVYFQALNDLSKKFKKHGIVGSTSDFLSSGIARVASAFICNPLTVIRTRCEVVGFTEYNNLGDAFKKIYKQEGIKGFYKGASACMLRDGPFAGLYYAIYNNTKKQLEPLHVQPTSAAMVSGLFAGFIATAATHPLEVVRTKMQVKQKNSNHYSGIYTSLLRIWSEEGMNGLTKGLAPRLMRKPLANALTFTLYDTFKQKRSHKA